MENNIEKLLFSIEAPKNGDEVGVGTMHKQAWTETYLNPEDDITKEVIDDLIGHVSGEGGNDYRRKIFAEARISPEKILYRVIKNNNGKIVGFMHCTKEEAYNELGGLYLLDEAKGTGVGGKLMEEFLAWADKGKPCQLEVFATNEKAIGFYTKYGFVKTDKPTEHYKDKLELIIMVRPVGGIIAKGSGLAKL